MKIVSHQVYMNSSYASRLFEKAKVTNENTNSKSTVLQEDFKSSQDSLASNSKNSKIGKVSTLQTNAQKEQEVVEGVSMALLEKLKTHKEKSKGDILTFAYEKKDTQILNFQTQGIIKAEDKEIIIDLDVNLQKSFVDKFAFSMQGTKRLTDPLVITFDGTMPTLSEKKFTFDIDSDGQSDQISLLGSNSAFLVLDKNQNGRIDNGSELFGTQSGNGFSDLNKYDSDKNGWIDENDPIFDKLQIWQKREHEDVLIGIGEVGIGAIFLGNVKTDFNLKSSSNSLEGQLKRSSFVVFEDGRAGVASQVDLAIGSSKVSSFRDEMAQMSTMRLSQISRFLENDKAATQPSSLPKSFQDEVKENTQQEIKKSDETEQGSTKKGSIDEKIQKLQNEIKSLQTKLNSALPKERKALLGQIAILQSNMIELVAHQAKEIF